MEVWYLSEETVLRRHPELGLLFENNSSPDLLPFVNVSRGGAAARSIPVWRVDRTVTAAEEATVCPRSSDPFYIVSFY